MAMTLTFVVNILILAIILDSTVVAINYCYPSLCSDSTVNIGCKYNGKFKKACSPSARIVQIKSDWRNLIVDEHNKLRNDIASGLDPAYTSATRMATMQWNDDLTNLAKLNVKQCAMKHDQCRNSPQFRYAGQNLAYASWFGMAKTLPNVALQQIQMWFDEKVNASMQYIHSYSNPLNSQVIGHFTQVVQEKATDIGCSILTQTKNGISYQFMACNYARTNIFNEPVYTSGPAASACATGYNTEYSYLCSPNEAYDVNEI